MSPWIMGLLPNFLSMAVVAESIMTDIAKSKPERLVGFLLAAFEGTNGIGASIPLVDGDALAFARDHLLDALDVESFILIRCAPGGFNVMAAAFCTNPHCTEPIHAIGRALAPDLTPLTPWLIVSDPESAFETAPSLASAEDLDDASVAALFDELADVGEA